MSDTQTLTRPAAGSELIARAQALLPLIREKAGATEAAREITPVTYEAMRDAGMFRLTMPPEFGGLEPSLSEVMRVLETLAQGDTTPAWVTWVACGVPAMSAFFSPEGTREMFGAPEACTAATIAAMGRAVKVEGGYRVTGRWPFASGVHHATYAGGTCFVFDGEEQRMTPDGGPVVVVPMWPVSDCRIIDVWQTTGLRGTGSDDIEVDDLFVPEHLVGDFSNGPRPGLAPLYYIHEDNAANVTCAAMAAGIAQRAIDAFRELGPAKRMANGSTLAESPLAQIALTQAVTRLSAARGHLYETVEMYWDEVVDGTSNEEAWLPRTSLASVAAVDAAIETVVSLYRAAGTSAIFSKNAFDRCLRDVMTLGAHRTVQRANLLLHGASMFEASA